MDIHEYPWTSWDFHGSPWVSLYIHGYPWISMDIHGYPYGSQPRGGGGLGPRKTEADPINFGNYCYCFAVAKYHHLLLACVYCREHLPPWGHSRSLVLRSRTLAKYSGGIQVWGGKGELRETATER